MREPCENLRDNREAHELQGSTLKRWEEMPSAGVALTVAEHGDFLVDVG